MGWIGFIRSEKFQRDFVARTCTLTAPARPVLHQNLCSHKMVENNVKHEFRVQWGGSDAFVAKNSDATSFNELVR
jgi:hypothetical protein